MTGREREAELRLAQIYDVLQDASIHEDTGVLENDPGAFLSALDYAVRGDSGCNEPEEWDEEREHALDRWRERLAL